MITALLGFIIFSESLPPLWWVGAAFLVAGNVIIGRREEEEKSGTGEGLVPGSAAALDGLVVEERENLLGDAMELDEEGKRAEEVDDPL